MIIREAGISGKQKYQGGGIIREARLVFKVLLDFQHVLLCFGTET